MSNQHRKQDWFGFRDKIIERDGDMCVRCGRSSADGAILQVHHKQYIFGKKPWEYPDDFCETLCKRCHAVEHGIIPPNTGWELLFDDDLEDLSGVCEYCGSELRYVFYVQHPKWPVLGVGTVCCDNLTGTEQASNKRKYHDRRKRFIGSKRWELLSDGVHKILQKNISIEIVPKLSGYKIKMNGVEGKKSFATIEDAKKHVFDVTENEQAQIFLSKQ